MNIFKKEFLYEELKKSIKLYSENYLNTLAMLSRMRLLQAPYLKEIFQKVKDDVELSEEDRTEFFKSREFDKKISDTALISHCSTFDAFLTDIETIITILEHKGKLTSIKVSSQMLIDMTPEDIVIKGARDLVKAKSFGGIKSRVSSIYTDFKFKNRPDVSVLEQCGKIFAKRNRLIHAPFSFSEGAIDDADVLEDNDNEIQEAEKIFAKISYDLCKQVIEKKFKRDNEPLLLLLKGSFTDPEQMEKEFSKLEAEETAANKKNT